MSVATCTTSVYVCDDETPVRVSVRYFLERYDWIQLKGSGATPDECIADIEKLKPDVATVDVYMRSKQDGLRTFEGIGRVSPGTRIIAYSAFLDHTLTMTLSDLGVTGFVDKGSDLDALVEAIKAVSSGQMYTCTGLAKDIAKWSLASGAGTEPGIVAALSPGQIDVLKLIVEGLTSDEISARLNLELSTIRTQRRRLMQKFGAHNVAQLIEAAARHGYIR